jgi:hypothetical protein
MTQARTQPAALALAGRHDLEPAARTRLTLCVQGGVMLAAVDSLRLDAFAIAACGPAEPIGTLLTRRRHTTNLTSPARSRPLRRANRRMALSHCRTQTASYDRTPLLRFLPLQRLPARDALSAAAVLRTIPLRRFLPATRPARPRTSGLQSRPCGFSLCEHDAVKLDDGHAACDFACSFAPRVGGGG